jgi:hypothetical protein
MKPFVMLIDSKQVIHTSSPELSPLKLLGFPLMHKLHLKCSKVQNDHIPVIAG